MKKILVLSNNLENYCNFLIMLEDDFNVLRNGFINVIRNRIEENSKEVDVYAL